MPNTHSASFATPPEPASAAEVLAVVSVRHPSQISTPGAVANYASSNEASMFPRLVPPFDPPGRGPNSLPRCVSPSAEIAALFIQRHQNPPAGLPSRGLRDLRNVDQVCNFRAGTA